MYICIYIYIYIYIHIYTYIYIYFYSCEIEAESVTRMAHTVIPPPRGTTATLELTHKGNINERPSQREIGKLEISTLPCLRVPSPVVNTL